MARIQVLVNDTAAMNLREGPSDREPERDRLSWITMPRRDVAEKQATDVLEDQPRSAIDNVVTEWLDDRGSGKQDQDRVLVMKVRDGSG